MYVTLQLQGAAMINYDHMASHPLLIARLLKHVAIGIQDELREGRQLGPIGW